MKQKVLIIDDSEDDILITQRVLSRFQRGIRAEVACSGEAGLAALRDGRRLPGLILLDLKMPGMDGIDVLRRIRGDERIRHIPVVILTNSVLERDESAAYGAGANGFLHKAFDLERFEEKLRDVLNHWLVP